MTNSSDDLIEVTIAKPIEAHGDTVTVLKLREPTVDDLESANNNMGNFTVTGLKKLIARLASIPPSSVGKLTMRDLLKVQDALAPFLGEENQSSDS